MSEDSISRRSFLKKAGAAVGIALGLGGAAAIGKQAIENADKMIEKVTSPESTAGYKVKLGNHIDTKYYSLDGEPFVMQSGEEFIDTVGRMSTEKKVNTGIKIVASTRTDGTKVPAFQIQTQQGQVEWSPVDPKVSSEPLATPFFEIASEDKGNKTLFVRYQQVDGQDSFKLYPSKFNRSPALEPVDKLP